MTTKKTKAVSKQPKLSAKQLAESIARVTLLPSANAAAVIADYAKPFGEQSVQELMDALSPHMNDVHGGNLKNCESMLVGQAAALQSVFVSLARRAASQEYMKQYETYLRLALKAQNQCRMTLETLATIKNPPVVYAKQANFAQGHQQINNGQSEPDTLTCTRAHAEQTINQQNELLEVQHGSETVDARTTGKAIGNNPAMATLD